MGPYPEWTQEISSAGWMDEEWGSLPHTQKARALYLKSGALVMVPLLTSCLCTSGQIIHPLYLSNEDIHVCFNNFRESLNKSLEK